MNIDDLDEILDFVLLDDLSPPELNGGWWELEVEDSAVARLHPRPRGQAVIGRGTATSDGVDILLLVTEVVDGPYVVVLATDTEFENHVQARVSWSHDEVGELIGGS